jgi:hypothetical protein
MKSEKGVLEPFHEKDEAGEPPKAVKKNLFRRKIHFPKKIQPPADGGGYKDFYKNSILQQLKRKLEATLFRISSMTNSLR